MFEAILVHIKESIKKIVTSRLFILGIVIVALMGILLHRLFVLQIINGEEYLNNYTLTIKKERITSGTRGNIFDRNGKLMAYNELSYSVTIEDNGYYLNSTEKNKTLNAELMDIIQMIEDKGDTMVNDFSVVLGTSGNYEFNISGTSLKRFLADVYGYTAIDKLKYNTKLGYDEGLATPEQVIDYLRSEKKFNIKMIGIDEPDNKTNAMAKEDKNTYYTKEDAYKILAIRYAMSQNSYQKYILTTIARGVSDETVAVIKENSDSLPGVDIAEDTIRKYVDSIYFSHIIGYTGKISQEEYENLVKGNKDYLHTDVVGKSGIEQYYEEDLQGAKGKVTFYVDNVGRVLEVTDKVAPTSGNDVYISLDSDLQIAVYDLLEQQIAGIVYSSIENIKEYNANAGASASDIKIPIDDVYYALINNNVIDISALSYDDASETQKEVYRAFCEKQDLVLSMLRQQLILEEPDNYEDLDEEMQVYMSHILTMLTENKIFLSKAVNVDDEIYKAWKSDKTSLSKYLRHAIAQDWIDIKSFDTESKYSDSTEIYDALLHYIEDELKTDLKFTKRLYKYMLKQDLINGTQISLILFDQEILDYNEMDINQLRSGEKTAFDFIKEKVKNIEITPAQLALDPCTGSSVIIDAKTGELLACVSYPGYDTNRLANTVDANYYSSLQSDLSLPQYNNATQQGTAPGSTFKLITAAAALTEGVITTETRIDDIGIYEEVTPSPSCWIYPASTHGNINIAEAIRDSCNYFFYEVAHRLGSSGDSYNEDKGIAALAKYANMFGLGAKTGIEIPESSPQISNVQPITSAIGQGENNFTTISLARYVTAVASRGNVYDLTLLDKITDSVGTTLKEEKPKIASTIDAVSDISWNSIQNGMRMVVEENSAFKDFPIAVAGKTGTAQQIKTRPNHALFIGYAPFDNPQIAIATRIAYGYSSANAAAVSSDIMKYYFNLEAEENLLSGQAQDVGNNANSFTD
ncbi:peptidoglycan glycosyltransferase [Lachnospiraceae bacterium ZAX-1]